VFKLINDEFAHIGLGNYARVSKDCHTYFTAISCRGGARIFWVSRPVVGRKILGRPTICVQGPDIRGTEIEMPKTLRAEGMERGCSPT